MRMGRLFPVLLLLSLVFSLTGCGARVSDAVPAPAPLTKLSVRLDWTPNALHGPIYAALEKGYYRDAGLDVTVNPATDKDDVLKLVDTGVDTLGLYYQSSVMKAQSKGYNLVSVGAYVQHPLNVVLVDRRAGVNSLKELEGKTVGFTSDPQPKGVLSTTAAALKLMVEQDGGDFSKVKLLNVGDAAVQALATRRVDALGGVYEYHEKLLLDKEGIATDVYRLNEHGAPDFYELVLVTSAKNAADQADAIKRFMAATEKGVRYMKEQPDDVVNILLKTTPGLTREMVQNAIPVVLPLYQENGQPFGAQSRDRWDAAAAWMVSNKLISGAPDFDRLLGK